MIWQKKIFCPPALHMSVLLPKPPKQRNLWAFPLKTALKLTCLKKVDSLCTELFARIKNTETLRERADTIKELIPKARFVCDELHSSMSALRAVADELENTVAAEYWPVPTYRDLRFSV